MGAQVPVVVEVLDDGLAEVAHQAGRGRRGAAGPSGGRAGRWWWRGDSRSSTRNPGRSGPCRGRRCRRPRSRRACRCPSPGARSARAGRGSATASSCGSAGATSGGDVHGTRRSGRRRRYRRRTPPPRPPIHPRLRCPSRASGPASSSSGISSSSGFSHHLLVDDVREFQGGEGQELDRLLHRRRQHETLRHLGRKRQALLKGHGLGPGLGKHEVEIIAEVDAPHLGVGGEGARRAGPEDLALADDVGAIGDAEGLADVVVGDQDPEAALLEVRDDPLDVRDRDGVDAREGLVEQDEEGRGGKGPADLEAAALAAREGVGPLLGEAGDAEFVEQLARRASSARAGSSRGSRGRRGRSPRW